MTQTLRMVKHTVLLKQFQSVFAAADEDVSFLKVTGTSMEPSIKHGEYVAVCKTDSIIEGHISLIQLKEGKILKRIRLHEDGFLLESDNSAEHPPMFVKHGELQVLGVISHIITPLW